MVRLQTTTGGRPDQQATPVSGQRLYSGPDVGVTTSSVQINRRPSRSTTADLLD